MELPESLLRSLAGFSAKRVRLRLLERVFSAALIVTVILMAFCLVERLVDIGCLGRTLVSMPMTLIVLGYAWREFSARSKPKTCQHVAEEVQRLFPEFGDRLLGAVELAYDEEELGEISPGLRVAALNQVAAKVASYDLTSRLNQNRWRSLALSFVLLLVPLAVYAAIFPQVFLNSLARLNNPWTKIDRFTFTRFAITPEELFTPQGEAFKAAFNLDVGSRVPGRATLSIGDANLSSPFSDDGRTEFELPPLKAQAIARIKAGDSPSTDVKVTPIGRPAIKSIEVELLLPDYLRLPTRRQDAAGAVVKVVSGSSVSFDGAITRPLSSFMATLTSAMEKPLPSTFEEDHFKTAALSVSDGAPIELSLKWVDLHQIASDGEYRLRIIPDADHPPEISCPAKSRQMAILENERMAFPVTAKDDFGVRTFACSWRTADDNGKGKSTPASEVELAEGSPSASELAGEFVLDPTVMGIPAETLVTFNFLAKDYNPATDATPSVTDNYQVHVLSHSQHLDLILSEMAKLSERLELIIQEEEGNRRKNDELIKRMGELESKAATKESEKLKAAEDLDRKRLDELSKRHMDLLKEALRNSRIPADSIKKWLDAAGAMKEVASEMFPKAVGEFQQASERQDGRKDALERALESQDSILRALQKTQQAGEKSVEELKFLNMATRLNEAAAKEERLVKAQMTRLPQIAGKTPKELSPELRIEGEGLAAIQESIADSVGEIKGDMEALLDRRKVEAYAQIVEGMRSTEIIPGLRKVGGYFRGNVLNKGIRDGAMWAKTLRAWADSLKPGDAKDGEERGGEMSEAEMEALIAIGRILNQESALRERTRDADKALRSAGGNERAVERHKGDSARLTKTQTEIIGLLDGVMNGAGCGKLKGALKDAEAAMGEAKGLLTEADTGKKAVGAETEAIELLSMLFKEQSGSSRRMMAMLGALGLTPGGNPGGGGSLSGGSNVFSSGSTPQEQKPSGKGVGGIVDLNKVPAEYRDAVKNYFDNIYKK